VGEEREEGVSPREARRSLSVGARGGGSSVLLELLFLLAGYI
jgi:hypothetical protein